MRVVKYDKLKHEQEKKAREAELKYAKEAADYYERLREDRRFQKYVVEGIFKKNIAELTDTRKIIAGMKKDTTKEEIGDLVMQSIIAAKMLEKMLSEIMN